MSRTELDVKLRRKSRVTLKWRLLFAALGCLAILLYPFQTTVVPEQQVLVVTRDMRPLSGVLVRQIWQHYSLEHRGHEEDLRTNGGGRVTFPTRTIRASLLWRMIRPIGNVLTQGVHSSFGIHADMFPLGEGTISSPNPVEPQPGEIVFRLGSSDSLGQ